MLRVAVVFCLLLGVLLPLIWLSGGWSGWQPITSLTAAAAGAVARALGIHATVHGNLIVLTTRTLSIDPQCTAVTVIAVYVALVLAYPLGWKTRLLAIGLGVPILLIVNIVRLVGVAWASELIPGKAFYLVHDYLYEFGMILVVLIMWAVWLSRARRTA